MTDGGIAWAFLRAVGTIVLPAVATPIVGLALGMSFLGAWGLALLASEALWVWLPATLFAAVAWRLTPAFWRHTS